jgi:hypothetical protein
MTCSKLRHCSPAGVPGKRIWQASVSGHHRSRVVGSPPIEAKSDSGSVPMYSKWLKR